MSDFNNESYEAVVGSLINDIFYLEELSDRGKAALIRSYAEVIVRRIFDISETEEMTLGKITYKGKPRKGEVNYKEMFDKKVDHEQLRLSIESIQKCGNKYTHTKELDNPTEIDITELKKHLYFLFSYLFIEHFDKYPFGSCGGIIMNAFSALPPFIRRITLENLFNKNPENVYVIDKLVLAILKDSGLDAAVQWLEERKEQLLNQSSLTDDVREKIMSNLIKDMGILIAEQFVAARPNMYELCMEKIFAVNSAYYLKSTLDKRGLVYKDFESSIYVYLEEVILDEKIPAQAEFKSIMDFLYLGRKSKSFSSQQEHLTAKEVHAKSLSQLNPNDQAFLDNLYKNAKAGDIMAQYNLGNIYLVGQIGLEKNYSEAARWFTMASRLGDEDANLRLSAMHAMGIGVKKDLGKAIEFMKLAVQAEQNIVEKFKVIASEGRDPSNLLLVAALYYYGIGVTVDERVSISVLTHLSNNTNSLVGRVASDILESLE